MNYPTRRPRQQQRRTLTGVATRAAVVYGTYKIASWAWKQWGPGAANNTKEEENIHNNAFTMDRNTSKRKYIRRRRYQLLKCYQETMNTVHAFMSTLKPTIESKTDFSSQTKRLKQIRKSRKEEGIQDHHDDIIKSEQIVLWNDIKIKSLVRLFTSLYVHSVLYLLLTVQVNLLGGIIFRNNDSSNISLEASRTEIDKDRVDEATHKDVLMRTFEHFFDIGIDKILDSLTTTIEKETRTWVAIQSDNRLGTVTKSEFMSLVDKIRDIEKSISFVDLISSTETQNSNADNLDSANDVHLVKRIIDETLDIVESPVFEEAKHECFDLSFETMKKSLHSNLFRDNSDSIHLVHLFGKLKSTTNIFYEQSQCNGEMELMWSENQVKFPNIYLSLLDKLDIVKELGDVSFN